MLNFILKGKFFTRKIYAYFKNKKQKEYNRIKKSNIELIPFPIKRDLIVNNKKRFLRGDEYLYYMGREFEPGLTKLLKKISLFCRNKVVLDVGAHIGITSIIFSEFFEEVIDVYQEKANSVIVQLDFSKNKER